MDAVIIWTDTEGKEYRREKIACLRDKLTEDIGMRETRTRDDFILTLAAAARNMTDLGRIYVISAFPPAWVNGFMEDCFPEKVDRLRLVGFRELFSGFEGFLPSFSSIAAATLLYRYHKMDDRFVLFRPGCIPMLPFSSSILTRDGIPVYHGSIRRSDALSGRKERIFLPGPMPAVYSRKDMGTCLADNPGLLSTNLRHRFDSPISRNNPGGQIDLDILIANRDGALTETVEPGRRMRRCRHQVNGTMIQRLYPCDDSSFSRAIKKCGNASFLDLAPLSSFPESQRHAATDFLCHKLQIRLP